MTQEEAASGIHYRKKSDTTDKTSEWSYVFWNGAFTATSPVMRKHNRETLVEIHPAYRRSPIQIKKYWPYPISLSRLFFASIHFYILIIYYYFCNNDAIDCSSKP